MPRKDQCDTSMGFAHGNVPADTYHSQVELKNKAREAKESDQGKKKKKLAVEDNNVLMIAVDARSVQMLPPAVCISGPSLSLHGDSIFNDASSGVVYHMWTEDNGFVGERLYVLPQRLSG